METGREAAAWLAEQIRHWREDPNAATAAGLPMPWEDLERTFGARPAEADGAKRGGTP